MENQDTNQSILSRIKNPWDPDRTIMPKFNLEDKVKISGDIDIAEAKIVEIQLYPSSDSTIPRRLHSPLPVYKLSYASDSNKQCLTWHAEDELIATS